MQTSISIIIILIILILILSYYCYALNINKAELLSEILKLKDIIVNKDKIISETEYKLNIDKEKLNGEILTLKENIAGKDNIILEKNKILEQKQKTNEAEENVFKANLTKSLQDVMELKMKENREDLNKLTKEIQKQYSDEKTILSQSINESSQKLSDELLKKSEEKFKNTSEEIVKNLAETVNNSANIIKNLKEETTKLSDSFLGANKTGQFCELKLENKLESLGFKNGVDFFTQMQLDSGKRRPDIVLKLPDGDFMIIDCKFSDSFEFKNINTETADEREKSLIRNMSQHIKNLSSKEYIDSLLKEFKKSYNSNNGDNLYKPKYVFMYLPTEQNIQELVSIFNKIDKDFYEGSEKNNIIPIGPTSLNAILTLTNYNIKISKMDKEYSDKMQKLTKFVESMAEIFKELIAVGKGIKSSADHYENIQKKWNKELYKKFNDIFYGISSNSKIEIKEMPIFVVESSKEIKDIEEESAIRMLINNN